MWALPADYLHFNDTGVAALELGYATLVPIGDHIFVIQTFGAYEQPW